MYSNIKIQFCTAKMHVRERLFHYVNNHKNGQANGRQMLAMLGQYHGSNKKQEVKFKKTKFNNVQVSPTCMNSGPYSRRGWFMGMKYTEYAQSIKCVNIYQIVYVHHYSAKLVRFVKLSPLFTRNSSSNF